MIKSIITVYDIALRVYIQPLGCVASDKQVRREMTEYVNAERKETPPQLHPEDFEVYKLGEFDEETGLITPVHPPERLFRLSDLLLKS